MTSFWYFSVQSDLCVIIQCQNEILYEIPSIFDAVGVHVFIVILRMARSRWIYFNYCARACHVIVLQSNTEKNEREDGTKKTYNGDLQRTKTNDDSKLKLKSRQRDKRETNNDGFALQIARNQKEAKICFFFSFTILNENIKIWNNEDNITV